MFVVWAIFIPFGSFIARYLKKYPWWFNVHRIINTSAILMMITAFIIAVTFTGSHFYSYHAIFGLVIVLLGAIQPVLGILADKWFSPDRGSTPVYPDVTHWIIGWVTILSGLVNIALGIEIYIMMFTAGQGILIAYIVFGGLVALFLLVAFIWTFVAKFETKHDSKDTFAFNWTGGSH